VIALAALLALALAAPPVAADQALLPETGAVAGCAREGAVEVYPGAELYGLIDGGAEVFLELGFDRVTLQRYRCGGHALSLELYRMSDATAALGVYLAKCGQETPDPGLAPRHTVGRLQLQLVKGSFYVVATGDAPADGLREVLLALAGAAVAGIADEPYPDPFAALPKEGLVPGSERVIRGPFALQALVTLGDGDVLQLQATGVTAVAGSYLDGRGARFTRVLADYPAVTVAAGALAFVAARLDPYLTPLEHTPARLAYRDHAGRFGVLSVTGPRLELLCDLPARP